MNIDENINYVKAQEKMIIAYLSSQEQIIRENDKRATNLFAEIKNLRLEIRTLKKELIDDERLPSIADIEKKVKLQSKVDFYNEFIIEINEKIDDIYELSKDWKQVIQEEKKLSEVFLSVKDKQKIFSLENNFKKLLSGFEYSSKSTQNISISRDFDKDFLLPVVENGIIKYNLRYDSSGSDWIRASWGYYCALFKVSQDNNTNHPKLLMLDEPAQQEMSDSSYTELLKELEKYKDAQVLVFSSFHNSEINYKEVTAEIKDFKLIEVRPKLMKPLI